MSKPRIHILNNQITNNDKRLFHPLEEIKGNLETYYKFETNLSDNYFLNKFIKLLNQNPNNKINNKEYKVEKIKDKIYRLNLYKNQILINELILYFEHCDSGGRDISKGNDSKKISLPTHKKEIMKYLLNYDKVLIINYYVPLILQNNKIELDINNVVYLLVKPECIYFSKTFLEQSYNSSNRWISLNYIHQELNNHNNDIVKYTKLFTTKFSTKKSTKNKNVVAVHQDSLPLVFEMYLYNYDMCFQRIKDNIAKDSISKNDTIINVTRKFQSLYKRELLEKYEYRCAIANCNIRGIKELLIASHIWGVSEINNSNDLSIDMKWFYAKDVNNGLLLCPNHDKIFDRHMITIDLKHNKIVLNDEVSKLQKVLFFDVVSTDNILGLNKEMIFYLNKHNESFKKINHTIIK
ncbi:hypothetical protein GE118_02445 [Mycoplasma sp. NEAQ87857]|uniref:HNH endonuclease n=1 Tax=Mycoplasma sp. NEAQ87857 TaxID=2683967 RepID=UPI001317C188|nr:HNH endonuclease [Mycoplasma sp. NEAQ87857]QGZ97654.1 hypothetical protein GE118_02445 [Mycoplasma sp. NEAQ87857]